MTQTCVSYDLRQALHARALSVGLSQQAFPFWYLWLVLGGSSLPLPSSSFGIHVGPSPFSTLSTRVEG